MNILGKYDGIYLWLVFVHECWELREGFIKLVELSLDLSVA